MHEEVFNSHTSTVSKLSYILCTCTLYVYVIPGIQDCINKKNEGLEHTTTTYNVNN